MDDLPFDLVEVKNAGVWTAVALVEWLKTECTERVEQIISGQVQFKKAGLKVPTTAALSSLKNRVLKT